MKKTSVFLLLCILCNLATRVFAASSSQLVSELKAWQEDVATEKTLANEEKDLRIDLINRLIFQVQAKYVEAQGRQSMSLIFEDMRKTDTRYTRFLTQLGKSFAESLEPNENLVAFIRDYTEYSSMSQPEPWENFARERDYFDGKTSFTANPMQLEDAADEAEAKLKQPEVPTQILIQKSLSDDFS